VILPCIVLFSQIYSYAEDSSPDQALAQAKLIYSQQGPKAALPEYEKVLDLYRTSGDKIGEAIAVGLIGNCYKRLGDYSKALEMLNSALAMKRELHERLEEGRTLSHIGLVYWEQGLYPKAIEALKQSITIAREMNNVQLEAAALNNISLVYDEQGDYRHSLEQYQKALELHRSVKYEPGESDTLGNIGGVYLSLGRFSEAETYYRQALEISQRLELKPSETQDIGNIAQCQLGKGKIRESIKSFDQAIAIAKAAGMLKEEADWYRGRASALLRVGKFDVALRDYEFSEHSYEGAGLKREAAETFTDSGMASLALGDRRGAEKRIRRAVNLSREIGYERGVALNELALAEVLTHSGDPHQALQTATKALAAARKLDESDALAQGLLLVGKIQRDMHLYGQARDNTEQARFMAHRDGLKLLEAEALAFSGELMLKEKHLQDALAALDTAKSIALETGDVDVLWHVQFHRGQALEQLHKNEDAAAEYRSAISTIEDVRALIAERRFRTGYLQDKQQVYVALISLLLRMGKKGEAFEYSERLREYSFLRFRESGAGGMSSPQLTESKARVERLQEMLDKEHNKPAMRQRSEAVSIYSDELVEAQGQLQRLLERDSHGTSRDALISTRSEAVSHVLPPHTAVLEYVVDENKILIFVLTRSGLQAVVSPVRDRDLRSKIELFRDLIADDSNEAWRKPAESLRTILISSVETKRLLEDMRSLIIVPHGMLNYLPFAALLDPRGKDVHFLAEQYEISELPASTLLLNPAKTPNSDPTHVLALAPTSSTLKFAIPEARQVGALFAPASEVIVGSRATETVFKATAGQYQIIHLATHGFFNRTNPLFSGLELEPDQSNDGRLEVYEVMTLHLNARLVTLSACDTALGSGDYSDVPAGDEFVGLSRAFLEAGSDAVLASLWKVNDRSTLVMMSRIYHAMKTHDGPQSLALAQRSMIRDPKYGHPFYWAPFVYVGGEFNHSMAVAEKP
jgi:CHAT domain-containing protein/Tfp pilus assembly protein PilF